MLGVSFFWSIDVKKHWTMHVIHHSHTDIGYTERQEKLERYHVDFIRQAVAILDRIHSGEKPQWKGFKWTCENLWQVERFLEQAPQREIDAFAAYVRSGEIGLSGNYLNMTELVDMDILRAKLRRGMETLREFGPIHSAMTADVNGYAWGYAQALSEAGVENLISCIHTHHGMFPTYRKNNAFWWEAPDGSRLLTYIGDVYHLGNEFVIAPNGGTSYTIRDELAADVYTDPFAVSEKRILRYLEQLEAEGFPHDIIPIMVSGVITDNGCPNGRVMEFIDRWNAAHGDVVTLRMSTLDDFFQALRATNPELPVYRGDCNDWWADGVGSTPAPVKSFRDAQRKLDLARKLDPDGSLCKAEWVRQAEDDIMLYAEHTWGYSSSVSEPWVTLVNDLDLRKTLYAVDANVMASRNLDRILATKGETTILPDRDKLFRVINPHGHAVRDTVRLYMEYWENLEGDFFRGGSWDAFAEVVDEATGTVLPSQGSTISRAREVEVLVDLAAGEQRVLRLRRKQQVPPVTSGSFAVSGAEGVADIRLPYEPGRVVATPHGIENDFFRVVFDRQQGIASIVDKATGAELVRGDAQAAPFCGIYQITAMAAGATETRRRMGRNRSDRATRQHVAQLTDVKVVAQGDVFAKVELSYALEGTRRYVVVLKAYRDLPKLTAVVQVHKESRWEPENLYIPLPFTLGEREELFVEKTGCVIRPGIDQIPGTNRVFYLLQNGMALLGAGSALSVAIKDAPLIMMGGLQHHPIELCSGRDVDFNRSVVYSWPMNNFWETNFKVDLGGFYEFEYSLHLHHGALTAEEAIDACRTQNEGLLAFYI